MNYLQKKKLAFMSIVNQIKGFVRTVTGVPPLSLPDCVDNDSLINYTIDGNSVQNGTPTPENSVEVKSVGEKTENIFDSSKKWDTTGTNVFVGYGGYSITQIDGGVKINRNSSVGWSNDLLKLEPNTTYTVSFKATTSHNGTNYIIVGADKKANHKYVYRVGTSTLTASFTTGENPSVFGFAHSNATQSSGIVTSVEITDIMFVKGQTETDYEPYGYKIPVVCSGKNLFKIRTPDLKGQAAYNGYGGTNHTVYDYGIRITEYAGIGFWFNDLEVGATYTLSCKFLTSGTSGVIFVIGQNQGQSATSTTKKQAWNNQLKEGQRVALTFTADETNLLSFGLGNSVAIEIGEIQLEKTSARTDHEPYVEPVTTNIYLDEPLAGGETLTNPVKLPTFKGTTIISVDTKIQPSSMSATYYATSKE